MEMLIKSRQSKSPTIVHKYSDLPNGLEGHLLMEARSVKIVVTCRGIELVMNPLTCRIEKDKKKKQKNKTFKRITKSVPNHNMHNSRSHFCQHVIKFM